MRLMTMAARLSMSLRMGVILVLMGVEANINSQ